MHATAGKEPLKIIDNVTPKLHTQKGKEVVCEICEGVARIPANIPEDRAIKLCGTCKFIPTDQLPMARLLRKVLDSNRAILAELQKPRK